MIDRRIAIAALLGALGAPGIAGAQSPRAARKIGYFHPTTIAPTHETMVILRRAWQALGYVEGETVLLRSAEGDPVRAGYAASVARPSGNVTGLFMDMASLAGKGIE